MKKLGSMLRWPASVRDCPSAPFEDGYERHRPQDSVLYQTLQAHCGTFVERTEQAGGLPKFVLREVKQYLACRIPEHGCALLECAACGLPRLVAFSCKRRGFCCCGRRMNDARSETEHDGLLPQS